MQTLKHTSDLPLARMLARGIRLRCDAMLLFGLSSGCLPAGFPVLQSVSLAASSEAT